MFRHTAFALLLLQALATDCHSQNMNSGGNEWLIPENLVLSGGVPKDGIPALTDPAFIPAASAHYLSDDDLIIGIVINGSARAYPHKILDSHEIINDNISGMPVSITYCPLTGSGMGWDRIVGGEITEFGVSGLLYNSNLIPYDRKTNSFWTQMGMQCVQGELKGQKINSLPVIETTWNTWREMYPETLVVSSNTGAYASYDRYPYVNQYGEDYRESEFLIFPVTRDDDRLHRKEKVHGIVVGQKSKVYPIKSFSSGIQTINDVINSVPVVIAGSSTKRFAISFERTLEDGTVLEFSPIPHNGIQTGNTLPAVMRDNEGTVWDVFGNGIIGPRAGTRLEPTESYDAYWFAWGTFFPGAEIHK